MADWFDTSSLFEAREISRQGPQQLISANQSPVDQSFDCWEFMGVRAAYAVNRADQFTGANAVTNTTTTPNDDVTTFVDPQEVFGLAEIAGDINVGDFTAKALSHDINQVEMQLGLQRIAIVDFWKQQIWRPVQANSFRGFPDLLPGGNDIPLGGAAFTLNNMEQLWAIAREGNANYDDTYFHMTTQSLVHFFRQVRNESWPVEWKRDKLGRLIPAFHGYGILRNDNIPSDGGAGTNETDVWCITNGFRNNGAVGTFGSNPGKLGWYTRLIRGRGGASVNEWRLFWLAGLTVIQPDTCMARISGIINPPV